MSYVNIILQIKNIQNIDTKLRDFITDNAESKKEFPISKKDRSGFKFLTDNEKDVHN